MPIHFMGMTNVCNLNNNDQMLDVLHILNIKIMMVRMNEWV